MLTRSKNQGPQPQSCMAQLYFFCRDLWADCGAHLGSRLLAFLYGLRSPGKQVADCARDHVTKVQF